MKLRDGDLRTIIDWVLLAIIVALLLILAPEAGTSERLVRKSSDRWCLPRIGHGVSWVTGDDLNRLIDGWL